MLNLTKTSVACCLTAGLVWPVWADDHAETVSDAADSAAEAVVEAGEAATEAVDGAADAVDVAPAPAESAFDNPVDEWSYAIGMDIGGSFRSQEMEIDPQILAEAIVASYNNAEVKMTQEQAIAAIDQFQMYMQARQMEKLTAEQKVFFAENIDKEGVEQTQSGLQYQVLELGDGPTPGPTDQITLHYKGQLLDGLVFDSSYDRGEPVTLGVDQFIPGFSEGLQLLPVGSKGKLFIPGEIAYGMNPRPGGPIPPMAALIFDVEIIATEAPLLGMSEIDKGEIDLDGLEFDTILILDGDTLWQRGKTEGRRIANSDQVQMMKPDPTKENIVFIVREKSVNEFGEMDVSDLQEGKAYLWQGGSTFKELASIDLKYSDEALAWGLGVNPQSTVRFDGAKWQSH